MALVNNEEYGEYGAVDTKYRRWQGLKMQMRLEPRYVLVLLLLTNSHHHQLRQQQQ